MTETIEVDEGSRMTATKATELRAQFPPGEIGKLPRITCRDCSQARGTCAQHQKAKCTVCSSYMTTQHIHIDYVGHADVTSRLLAVDPLWSWEPVAWEPTGTPMLDLNANGSPVGLWIWLEILGVRRLGYGTCEQGQFEAIKVLIGDAIRNAAMRFGVALDLWAKGERQDPTIENATVPADPPTRRGRAADEDPVVAARKRLMQAAKLYGHGSDPATISGLVEARIEKPVPDATPEELDSVIEAWKAAYDVEKAQEQPS